MDRCRTAQLACHGAPAGRHPPAGGSAAGCFCRPLPSDGQTVRRLASGPCRERQALCREAQDQQPAAAPSAAATACLHGRLASAGMPEGRPLATGLLAWEGMPCARWSRPGRQPAGVPRLQLATPVCLAGGREAGVPGPINTLAPCSPSVQGEATPLHLLLNRYVSELGSTSCSTNDQCS